MEQKIAKMVTALFPDAIPGEDFEIAVLSDKNAEITSWNELKLGKNPGIRKIHDLYMANVKKKKELLPTFDDSDPLPYLSEQHIFRAFETNKKTIEVFNGCTFQKRH